MSDRRPLTPEETERLRKKLLARRDELWDEVKETLLHVVGEEYQERIQTIRDEEDLAQADLQEEIVLGIIESRKQELEAIAQALWRIESGEYGKCLNCRRWIRFGRLEARPQASYCSDCKGEMERAAARA